MPANDEEVFAYFRRDPNSDPAVDALAYASFSFDKYEWMAKREEIAGTAPTGEQVNQWISELPDSRLDEIQQTALEFFRRTVAIYISDARAEAYQAGKQDAIVSRVTEATSFWKNLPGNIAVGVVSSFAFAVILILAAVVFNKDPSPIAFYEKLTTTAPAAARPK
jgi:hypothetical protein